MVGFIDLGDGVSLFQGIWLHQREDEAVEEDGLFQKCHGEEDGKEEDD